MSGHTVRQRFIRNFRRFDGYSRYTGAAVVGFYVAQIIAAMAAGHWLLQQPLAAPEWIGLGFVMFFIGTRFRAFNNIVHECSHFSFTRQRGDNVFFGRICAALIMSSYQAYREEHMTHHAHLGNYDEDLDLQGIRDLRIEDPLTPRTILRHALTPILGRHLPYYLKVDLSGADGAAFLALKFGLIGAALVALAVDPLAGLLLVWLPFAWVFTAINYWTDCIDHGGLIESGDELESSRNVPLPVPLRWLLFPRNDCYHLVHHLFPQVPARHLGDCHRALMDHPEYRAQSERPLRDGILNEPQQA